METLRRLYRPSLALLTDLYQLTMACGYWKLGRASDEAVFHLFFRQNPFGGGYALACGLARVVEFLRDFRFRRENLRYLEGLAGADGKPLLERGFLSYLASLRLRSDVDAMPEGTAAFAGEPLVRVRGPLLECQLLETPLLNLLNFPTLVATKASRISSAARGEAVLEFGLRRAQGIDGALTASRAAYIGGCAATSNVLAGKLYGIPLRGTHAHSWVLAFDDELEAFEEYARALPNNCLFLVDTYDTLEGVRRAVAVGRELRRRGQKLLGIRLDSGDMARLSREARELLDEAGFSDAVIVGSNDLDEHAIARLKEEGARIAVWGVGTRLATCHDQPALGGVYKLTAVRRAGGPWQYRVKLSDEPAKTSTPGILQVRRFRQGDRFLADMIWNEGPAAAGAEAGLHQAPPEPAGTTVVLSGPPRQEVPLPAGTVAEDLLVPVARGGRLVYEPPPPAAARARALAQLDGLPPEVRALKWPVPFPVGLEKGLEELKERLIREARGEGEREP